MLTSLSLIFLVGLAMGAICSKLKLPRIIGMLATGIILGPYVLDLLDPSILSISAKNGVGYHFIKSRTLSESPGFEKSWSTSHYAFFCACYV